MSNGRKNFSKDAIFNTIGNLAYLGVIWVMTLVVTWRLGFENAGYFSIAMSVANIFISLASYTMRIYYAADIQKRYRDQTYIISRYITVIISIFLCVTFSFLTGYSENQIKIIILFYIFKSEEMISDVFYGTMQRYGKLYISGVSMIVKAVISLVFFLVSIWLFKDLIIALIGIDIAGLLIFIFFDYSISRKVSYSKLCIEKMDLIAAQEVLKVCFPLFVVGLCYNVIPSLPKIVFEKLYSSEELGFYSSIATITVLISTGATCIMMPLIPQLASYYQNRNINGLKKNLKITFFCIFLLGSICIFIDKILGRWTLNIMFGEKIDAYAYNLKWVIIAALLTSIIIYFNNFFTAIQRTKYVEIASILGVIICLITVYPLCKYLYMMGLTFTLIISQLIEIIMLYIQAKRILKRMEKENECNVFK